MTDRQEQKFDLILGDVESLLKSDPVFHNHFSKDYRIDRSRGSADMAALIRIVVGQQISNKVATALWVKLTDDINPNDPDAFLSASDDQLRNYGLSRQKISYVRGVAQAVKNGSIDITSWIDKDDVTVTKEITALKGFGPWSAQMFMMFNLCHRHIWPVGDLGLQLGLQKYFNLDDRPDEKGALSMRDHFKGHETAAAFLLWDLKGSNSGGV